jgi:hypothetical protein
MRFCEELKANNIDPDKFIAIQNEFIAYYRSQVLNRAAVTERDYIERDQLLTMIEKLINVIERERLQEKLKAIEMFNPSS